MATNLPYLPSNKNVGKLFSKISSAQVPANFTHPFLRKTIGHSFLCSARLVSWTIPANRPSFIDS